MKKGLSIGRSHAQYTVNELLPLAPHEKVITLFSKAINFVSLQGSMYHTDKRQRQQLAHRRFDTVDGSTCITEPIKL